MLRTIADADVSFALKLGAKGPRGPRRYFRAVDGASASFLQSWLDWWHISPNEKTHRLLVKVKPGESGTQVIFEIPARIAQPTKN